ncbi:Ribonuclease H-like domain containing protein [Elaphomyces granulatus]
MTSERVFTRGARRINYRLLNDGSDEEALPEDRIAASDLDATPEPQVPMTSDDSQMPMTTDVAEPDSTHITTATLASRRRERPALATEWVWPYFEATTVEREWIVKRTGKRRIVDRDICCAYVDEKTGTKCDWKTTDSVRQTATSNMKNHLAKHGILPPSKIVGLSQPSQQKPSIIALLTKKEDMTNQQRLEKNVLRWVVTSKQPFTVVQEPDFKQIFLDISGVSPPFSTRYTLRLAIDDEFKKQRLRLKDDLSTTCSTIALSLDAWTSSNSLPILAIIGHWLTTEFEYRQQLTTEFEYWQQVIEFTELQGPHSGENLAAAVEACLLELDLVPKLLSITGDNAGNNETMVFDLHRRLLARIELQGKRETELHFQGLDSYIRCLGHILNLIVKDILRSLGSGSRAEADQACDSLGNGGSFATESALGKLRILALWVQRSPQRRQRWKEVCRINNMHDKYIQYDVDTRWNSTYRMIQDGLNAEKQISKFLQLQTEFPAFTTADWSRLKQLKMVLSKFDEFTSEISKNAPQISMALPIYYDLHELLHDASDRCGPFSELDLDLVAAVKQGLKKYQKYYTFMDESDIYYTTTVLDPRIKGDLILKELSDGDAGKDIVGTIRLLLHEKYHPMPTLSASTAPQESPAPTGRISGLRH